MSPLTKREHDCIELVARGLENKQIAAALKVSLGTVKTHLNNSFGKLGARNRTAAAMAYTKETN